MYFTFQKDGANSPVNLTTYGVYLEEPFEPETAADEYEFKAVPGRDGSLAINKGGHADRPYSIKAYIKDKANLPQVTALLNGHGRLKASNDAGHSYLVTFTGGIGITRFMSGSPICELDIPVTVEPYRYLAEPTSVPTLTAAGSVNNRGTEICRPLIKITPSAANWSVIIAGCSIVCTGRSSVTYIDCELQDCINSNFTALVNNVIRMSGGKYPELMPGQNFVSDLVGITKIEFSEMRERDA